jgi:hypothetical protein
LEAPSSSLLGLIQSESVQPFTLPLRLVILRWNPCYQDGILCSLDACFVCSKLRGERERERRRRAELLTFGLDTSRANTKVLTAELDDLKGDAALFDRNVYIHYGFILRLSTNATE